MGISLLISPEAGFLRVVATGTFSLEEAKRTFLEVLDAVAEHRLGRVLFDGTAIAGKPATMERFYYGKFVAHAAAEFLAKRPVSCPLRLAYVLAPPVLDPRRFGETVAVNRGVDTRAFDNPDDALGWLAPVAAPSSAGEA